MKFIGFKHKSLTFLFFFFFFKKINMVQVSSEYISIGCNKTAHAACWGNNGLVAFGADTLIALYSPLVSFFLLLLVTPFFFSLSLSY